MQHYVVDSRTCLMEEQRSLWEFVPTWLKKGLKVEEVELTYGEHIKAVNGFTISAGMPIYLTKQKESGMTHAKEIKRWASCPDGTKVWYKNTSTKKTWHLNDWYWNGTGTYIVDDEYAELRKAHADGKKIEVVTHIGWVDAKINPEWKDKASSYRIKPKPKVAKMTMEQVIKELGYEVEITK